MGADIENEINKIRWERWRAKQKTEREKTCFYCWEGIWVNWNVNWFDWDGVWLDWPNWKQWGDWGSDWSDFCEGEDWKHCADALVEATLYGASNRIKVHYVQGVVGMFTSVVILF